MTKKKTVKRILEVLPTNLTGSGLALWLLNGGSTYANACNIMNIPDRWLRENIARRVMFFTAKSLAVIEEARSRYGFESLAQFAEVAIFEKIERDSALAKPPIHDYGYRDETVMKKFIALFQV